MNEVKKMTPLDAWADFWNVLRPTIWKDLSRAERRVLQMAQQDYEGKRLDRKRKPVSLGDERIEKLLLRFGGGRYTFERRVWVEVRDLSPDPSPSERGDETPRT